MDQTCSLPVHLRPLKNYVIVRQDPPKDQIGRFYVPQGSERFDNFGTIIAIGSDVEDVKPGDRVVFKRTPNSALYPDTRETVPDEFKNLLRLKVTDDEDSGIVAVIEEE